MPMIISCPSCKKKFEINDNLIPNQGRLLRCGSCNHTWFFRNQEKSEEKELNIESTLKENIRDNISKADEKISKKIYESNSNLTDNKGSELIKYKPKSTFTFSKFLSYIIVLIISFIAFIILLDTFKAPLSIFFPNLELILYNLFETIKDLVLFIKDLK